MLQLQNRGVCTHLGDGQELLQGDGAVDVQRVQHLPCTSSKFPSAARALTRAGQPGLLQPSHASTKYMPPGRALLSLR